MDDWRRILAESIVRPKDLAEHFGLDEHEIEAIVGPYPMRITPTVLGTIKEKGDAIWRQVVPDQAELADIDAEDDPLEEDLMSPVPHLVHRYPDRVLLMVTNQCPIYCRFCTRKRLVGKPGFLKKGELDRAIAYLREHTEVRDVILSGGDPLLLPDHLLERILKALRTIPHLELIRLGSRVPGTLPERITTQLCEIVKKYHPIYMNLHFNHPDELTPAVKAACTMLADAGVPLGAQTVLLKGVNDDPKVMKRLVHQLLLARVKPYYLYQADLTKGTNHFRTTVETGLNIIKSLQGHTSGMAVPHFVIDATTLSTLMTMEPCCATMRIRRSSIRSPRPGMAASCRWSARDCRIPIQMKHLRLVVTVIRTATGIPPGATVAAAKRTNCDEETCPGHPSLSADHPAYYRGRHHGPRPD
jgi:lysine 2,3-aminomutase